MLKNNINFILSFIILTTICVVPSFSIELTTSAKADKKQINAEKKGSETGRSLPRFVSLKSSKVNMRRGPGKEFRIDWVYYRKNLPVKIIFEYLRWRKIEDFEGYTGWVHASLLSGKKSLIIIGDNVPLRERPVKDASSIAYLKRHVLVFPELCKKAWCKVEINSYNGWVDRELVWGDF